LGLGTCLPVPVNLTVHLSEHPDAKEATAAFLEKRKPVFRD
jgi:enoyl-CoA hydratase/carnithine racemase